MQQSAGPLKSVGPLGHGLVGLCVNAAPTAVVAADAAALTTTTTTTEFILIPTTYLRLCVVNVTLM